MTTQNHAHNPFRSRQERAREVDLVQKYRGIGIAAVAAAGSRQVRLTPGTQAPKRQAAMVEAID